MLLIQSIYLFLVTFCELRVVQYEALVVGARQLEPLECVDHFKNLRVFVDFLAILVRIILADVLLELWLKVRLLLEVVVWVRLLHGFFVNHGST